MSRSIQILRATLREDMRERREVSFTYLFLSGGEVEIKRHWSKSARGRAFVAAIRERITVIRFLQSLEGEGLLAARDFGREAEELRSGLEALLERVSARDSLTYLVRTGEIEASGDPVGGHSCEPCDLSLHLLADALGSIVERHEGFSGRWNPRVSIAMDQATEPLGDDERRMPTEGMEPTAWPLPNVWIGVSVEDQATADERIPMLLQCPAAVRWVSLEPMLGPVELTRWMPWTMQTSGWNEPFVHMHTIPPCGGGRGIDWVIVGGESGPGARPCDVEWIRSVVRQCREAGVAAFVKQLGSTSKQGGFTLRKTGKGGGVEEFPKDLRVREFPEVRRG